MKPDDTNSFSCKEPDADVIIRELTRLMDYLESEIVLEKLS